MAKQSIVAVIRAKPGNRRPNYGKFDKLPIMCDTKGCKSEALLIRGKFDKREKLCYGCYRTPPQDKRTDARVRNLRSMGLIH
jgi:hypothetical protein